ncbi:MAG: hypothetical protein AAGI72_02010 [Pseudomonadota bacterium]
MLGRYLIAILVDLIVLNLFAEHSSLLELANFSTSLVAAVLLQLLLQATLTLEHRVAALFDAREGAAWTALRFFTAWLILFGSKFVMLGVIDRVLGERLHFAGPMHGVVAFIIVIVAMLAAEEVLARVYRRLQ